MDKGIAGILCMGMDPGAVNVFARWAMDRLDTASTIRVLDGDNAETKGYRFAVPDASIRRPTSTTAAAVA